jgi:hypothetical protein
MPAVLRFLSFSLILKSEQRTLETFQVPGFVEMSTDSAPVWLLILHHLDLVGISSISPHPSIQPRSHPRESHVDPELP